MASENIYSEKVKVLEKELKEKTSKDFEEFIDKTFVLKNEELVEKGRSNIFPNHFHICQFELEAKIKGKRNNWSVRKCKEYLKTKGLKRDSRQFCCDSAEAGEKWKSCKYLKTIYIDSDGVWCYID